MKENNYYNKKVEELYKELNTNISGLTEEEASKRLEKYGENKLAERKKKSNFIIFLNQFNDLMIILLIFASVFSAVISYIQKESYADSVIILIIVIINATLSFIEEKKADKAIEELNKMFITNNNVIRNGKKETIDVRKIVPGKNPLHESGAYYLQEPSAMSVVPKLNIEEGDKVLDLCAAPGGKSTYILSKLNNSGLLVSNEIKKALQGA